MRIDLHTHSRASDGTQSPTEVMRAAADAGLDVVALTDHDTAQGWAEATAAAEALGLELVTGIEVSTRFEHVGVHLLAYLPDADDPDLVLALDRVLEGRNSRVPAILANLRAVGIELTEDDVRRVAAGTPATGRPHVADALVAQGVVADRAEAFERYLNPGRPGYATRYAADLEDIVPMVVAAGGVPVVAHPWARSARHVLTEAAFARLRDLGLAGIEVDHQGHDPAARGRAARHRPQPRPDRHRVQRLPRHREGRPRARVQHHRARPARPHQGARLVRPGPPMSDLLDVTLMTSAFVTLFVIMDPVGTVPIFLSLTSGRSKATARRAAWQAVAVSFVVITAFAFFGQRILSYLHISLPALQCAGGLLLLLVALELLTGNEKEPTQQAGTNVALVPLGTPLLAGPGAIVATMLFSRRVHDFADFAAVSLAVILVHLCIWAAMRYSLPILRLIRESGVLLVTRIAGLLLSAIAVQLVADAVRAFIAGEG